MTRMRLKDTLQKKIQLFSLFIAYTTRTKENAYLYTSREDIATFTVFYRGGKK